MQTKLTVSWGMSWDWHCWPWSCVWWISGLRPIAERERKKFSWWANLPELNWVFFIRQLVSILCKNNINLLYLLPATQPSSFHTLIFYALINSFHSFHEDKCGIYSVIKHWVVTKQCCPLIDLLSLLFAAYLNTSPFQLLAILIISKATLYSTWWHT